MDAESLQLLIDAGVPIGLILYVVAAQWRKRNGDDYASRRHVESVVTEVRALARSLHEHKDDMNDQHRASERVARDRHDEVIDAIRKRPA